MNFSDYQDFRLAVQKLIEGDDVTQGQATFSIATLDLMVGLGEERVNNGDEAVEGLRASTMVTDLSLASPYALPADLLSLKELYFSGQPPLEIVTLDKLRQLIACGASTSQPRYAAQDGDELVFWPTSTSTVLGRYYAKPPALKTDWADNTTVTRYPDVYLYAAITEAMAFLGFDSRVPFWQGKWRTAQLKAQANERMRVFAGSPLRMRAR